MKNTFKRAHEMTREIKREYPEVDYRTQFGICVSYLLNNEEEKEMIMEKWYEGLTEKEKSKIEDITDNFMLGKSIEERPKYRNQVIEKRYEKYLKEVEQKKQREEYEKQMQAEQEEQRQQNLTKGIATIELYESNRYRCWAAEVTGTNEKYGLAREFINPVETAGNYRTYELKEGKYYNYLNDKKQHFVKVVNAELVEMTKAEMLEAMK